MKPARLSLAVAGMATSVAVGAALWPHARDAFAILAAQDQPEQLADIQINSALRNNQKIVADNIEQALAKSDADLANSFVELARAKNIARNSRRPNRAPHRVRGIFGAKTRLT